MIGLMRALAAVGERNAAEVERVLASYFRARDAMEPSLPEGIDEAAAG